MLWIAFWPPAQLNLYRLRAESCCQGGLVRISCTYMSRVKRPHSSRLMAYISVGLLLGLVMCSYIQFKHFYRAEWLVIGCGLTCIAFADKSRKAIVFALCAGLLLGLWRGSSELKHAEQYQSYYAQKVVVRGVVSDDTTYGIRGDQRILLNRITINDQQFHGTLWASTLQHDTIKRGDIVLLSGTLDKGFGNTYASMYRAKVEKIQRMHPGDIGRRVRDWFGQGIRIVIPEPQASLAAGFLLGQKSALPENLNAQLQIVGLTHVVVASGYNLTILVSLARKLFAKISKYLAALTATTMVLCFVLMTGFSPSMTRAGIIALLSLAAWYYGRIIHPVILLIFVAALTAMIQPSYIWGDIGWYLSFAAFAGVILFAPLLHRYFWGKKKKVSLLRQTAVDTMAAQLLTMPIILLSFGTYSTYALLANILILPLVPWAMLLSAIAGFMSVLPFGHQYYGLPAQVLLHYMTSVVSRIADFPHAQGQVGFTPLMAFGAYSVFLLIGLYMWRKTRYDFARPNPESELYSG